MFIYGTQTPQNTLIVSVKQGNKINPGICSAHAFETRETESSCPHYSKTPPVRLIIMVNKSRRFEELNIYIYIIILKICFSDNLHVSAGGCRTRESSTHGRSEGNQFWKCSRLIGGWRRVGGPRLLKAQHWIGFFAKENEGLTGTNEGADQVTVSEINSANLSAPNVLTGMMLWNMICHHSPFPVTFIFTMEY